MSEDFGAAMQRAMAAMRTGDMSQATGIIQQVLGNGDMPQPALQGLTGTQLPLPGRRMRRPLGEAIRTLRDSRTTFRAPGAAPMPAAEPALPDGAAFLEATHAEAAGSRRYRLYRPASLGTAPPSGLVVMLHGCTQTPEDFAIGTGMNRLAETHRLIVAYPEQATGHNMRSCWNWFRPGDQARDAGEPAVLAGLARAVAAEYGVPEARTFVAGLSAGGAMAALLGARYPDVFAGVGVHSGVAHDSANDVLSALAVMRGEHGPGPGPAPLLVPMILFHGDADAIVHRVNADRLAAAGREGAAPAPEQGSAGGRRFTRSVEARNGQAVEYWVIQGAGHAWSGGDPAGSYADRAGPDASAEMVRFFLESR